MASCSWKILLLQCLASDFLCGLAISYQSNIYVYTKKSKLCIRSSHGWLRVGFRILCVLLICLPQGLMDSFWCQLTPTLLKALMVHQVWTQYGSLRFRSRLTLKMFNESVISIWILTSLYISNTVSTERPTITSKFSPKC